MSAVISTPPASVRRRLASMLYEGLLLLGVLSVAFMLPHLALGMLFEVALPGPVLVIHVFIVLGFYFIWYWQHAAERSPCKPGSSESLTLKAISRH